MIDNENYKNQNSTKIQCPYHLIKIEKFYTTISDSMWNNYALVTFNYILKMINDKKIDWLLI